MGDATARVHFELFGRRDGRWVLEACFAREDEARAHAARIAGRPDVHGVRLTREVERADAARPVTTVILDSTLGERARGRALDAAAVAAGAALAAPTLSRPEPARVDEPAVAPAPIGERARIAATTAALALLLGGILLAFSAIR